MIVVVPYAFVDGVIVAVQFGYAHQKTIFPFVTRLVLLLVADTFHAHDIGVSTSLIVNAIPLKTVSSLVL